MTVPRKVFLSYRSVDRDHVRKVAEELRAAGIDAWWDQWEILPGDNFVVKINQGLEECDCGVVFLSNESLAGAWQQEEITILKSLAGMRSGH
jgi:TIR domain